MWGVSVFHLYLFQINIVSDLQSKFLKITIYKYIELNASLIEKPNQKKMKEDERR